MSEGLQMVLLGLALIGLVIIFIAVTLWIYFSGARKAMKKKGDLMTATTDATITKSYSTFDEHLISSDKTGEERVEYKFSVNGKPYTGKGKGHGQEGSTIKIYYNPEDPNMNLTDTHMDIWNGKTAKKTFLYVLIAIGAFILLAVLGGLAARFL